MWPGAILPSQTDMVEVSEGQLKELSLEQLVTFARQLNLQVPQAPTHSAMLIRLLRAAAS